ncbi:MAG TPA: hypothetical protein DIU00_09590, partial [Phycisphaerales bacterium]|nr:hypothetical protein [Phycisphaerales bacterium]
GIEHAQVDTDTGWRIEVKMPWLSIWGVAPQAGDLIGIDCYYNDDDDGGDSRENKMLGFSAVEGWNDASQWASAVLAATPDAEPVSVENLLANPSFEEDEAILDDPDWYQWVTWNPAEGAGSNATIVDTEAADGARSLMIEPIGVENWHFIVLYMPIPTEIGANYTTTFWARAAEPRPLAAQFKGTDNVDSWGYTDFELTTEWAEYSLTADALSTETKLEFMCAGVEVPFWLDFVLVYEGQYVPGIEPRLPVTIPVDPNSDITAANELAMPGDTIEFAEGTYYITSQIEIKDGVTYRGAGPGLTIIDGNDTTRAFVAWGDRSYNEGNENPNNSGPKGWVIEGITIQNCVADTNDRFSYTGSAFDMNDVFAENDADGSGGLSPEEANTDSAAIRLPGPDGEEGTEDDDLHRFAHMDTDGNGELSQDELLAQIAVSEDEFGDENCDGGSLFCGNGAVGTIANCEFLNNHTPFDGDDGGAIAISGLSVVTVNDCRFVDNYAVSTDGVKLDGHDGDGGHIKVQGSSASALTPGTTLIANRCDFLGGKVEDDGAAIASSAVGSIIRLDACWFEANTAADDGTVLLIGNESSGELTVTNCVFANNISTAASDRMCQVRRNSKFINCTFVGNSQDDQALIHNNANAADTDANGEDDELADVTQVVNCIFANNVVGNGDDVLKSRNAAFTIAATNCLFFGNTLQNGDPADNTQRPAEEVGSILTDPLLDVLFVPGVGSPAIDAGIDPVTVGVTITTDLSGNARPQGAAYDIGAYEVVAE